MMQHYQEELERRKRLVEHIIIMSPEQMRAEQEKVEADQRMSDNLQAILKSQMLELYVVLDHDSKLVRLPDSNGLAVFDTEKEADFFVAKAIYDDVYKSETWAVQKVIST